MNDAQQEMSPDFVLMRLLSAAEYDRLDEPDALMSGGGGFGPVKAVLGHHGGGFDLDPSGPSAGLGSSSPHYSSPLAGKGEMDAGLVLTQAPSGSEAPLSPPPTEDFAVAAQQFVDFTVPHGSGGHGSRAQLMVFQNLLGSGDRILECGLEQPPSGFLQEETETQRQQLDSGLGTGSGSTTAGPGPGGGDDQNSHCIPSAEEKLQPQQPQLLQWHPVLTLSKGSDASQTSQQGVPSLDSESRSVMCHRHRLLTDRLTKWPPGLLDQALRLGLLDPRKNCSSGNEDPVISLAQRLGQLGEGSAGGGGGELMLSLPRCSCHSVLASGAGGMGPGEDPSETSDALLVLEGLGSEEVGRLEEGGDKDRGNMGDPDKGGRIGGGAVSRGAGPVFSSGTLSGLMRQVHRLAEEAGVCTDQNCRSSLAILGAAVSLAPCVDPHPTISTTHCLYAPVRSQAPQVSAALSGLQVCTDPFPSSSPHPCPHPQHQHQSRSQPQSRATTPKLGVTSGAAGRSASPLVVLEGEVGGGGGGRGGEKTPQAKSRKGGSLEVRLRKLVLASGAGGMGPGEDPSETSDALLVLEGLGSEEVGRLEEGGDKDRGNMGDPDKGGRIGGGAVSRGAGPVFSSGTLSGRMRQVHRLAEEAGVCTDQNCRSSLAILGAAVSLAPCVDPHPTISTTHCLYAPVRSQAPQVSAALSGLQVCTDPFPSSSPHPCPHPQHQHQSRSQPQSRATTPKLGVTSGAAGRSASPLVVLEGEVGGGGGGRGGEKTPQAKSRKGGSLKVRLSKLFRTKSSNGGSGGLLDKRPSLASSTSSGGSLLDVWGSTCSSMEQDSSRLQVSRPHSAFSPVSFTPAFTGETVSLVDVDISRRGGNSLHPPTPPPPPRRSLSLLDDFGGPPQQQGPFMERSAGASMQSLPPHPLALPPSLSTIQHSLSLNGLPRPVPLRPNGHHPPPRLAPRCPLGRPDASNFATSLRELEKCGWYWGPMNWEDAEMKLKGKPDGSFLVRDSSDPRYILSLSFRSQGVTHHTRMEHYRGTFSLWCHPKFEDRCHSVVEFIERAIMHSKNGKFLYFLRSRVPGNGRRLTSHSCYLSHLCRFCIRQLVRIDHIQELPLPTPLIAYLRKFYYYDPEEEISPMLQDRVAEKSSQPRVESQT
uniref:uncharacterized protein LOC109973456 n=1 Tax=Monopterus albus TaxID=43700 RepID=UPI0009B47D0D|nr:uncharacterized protein LOC109973456 [Monopterus albus]